MRSKITIIDTNSSNQFTVEAGTDLPLKAYFLGDLDGGYADQIA